MKPPAGKLGGSPFLPMLVVNGYGTGSTASGR